MKRIIAVLLSFLLATNVLWTSFGCGGGSSTAIPVPDVSTQKGVVHYISDHLGNANLITDPQGNVLREESRYPYGLDWRIDGDAALADYVYTGKEYDEETGLVYFGGRYYSPEMGRWITPDPLFINNPAEATKRPLESNLYSYTVNNPINYVDPNGEWAQIALAVAAVGLMFASDAPGGFASSNANFATAIMPILNDYRDIYELATGKDLITKGKLSFEDRIKCSYGLVLGSGALFRQLPKMSVTPFEDFAQFKASWAGDTRAGMILETSDAADGRFGFNVTYFNRGDFPTGSEKYLLSDTLYFGLGSKPDFIRFQNVDGNNLPFEEMIMTTANDLGGQVTDIRAESRMVGGVSKIDVIGDIEYRFIK